jgi:hypothetical protein
LARNFRWYDKKRGHRRTGSSRLGRAGELLFFAAFFLLGAAGLAVIIAWFVVPQWRVQNYFIRHTCTVLDTRLGFSEDGAMFRPEIEIEYCLNGENYRVWTYDIATARNAANSYSSDKEGKQAVLDAFVPLKQYPCWYDPDDPSVVVLERGYGWWVWLLFIVPVSFLLIGGGGLLYALFHWGKSTERSSVLIQRAQNRELLSGNGRAPKKYPFIPDGSDIINSPGTKLKYRLPIGTSPGWALLGTLLLCLLWNGILSVFVVLAVGSHMSGRPDWMLTVFVLPFLAVGIMLIVLFVRQMLVTTGIGPTFVEISDHPLIPGWRYSLFLTQAGRLKVKSLDLTLICQEQATYRQGTDTRTETRQVFELEMFHQEDFEVQHGVPFEVLCEFTVPEGVMHSFKAGHNQISWRVVVKGDVAGWPDFKRAFPVIVYPRNGT